MRKVELSPYRNDKKQSHPDHIPGAIIGIKGGRIAGEQVAVDRAHLFQDRDYPVLNDYCTLFGGQVQRVYGLDQSGVQRAFASVKPSNLGLL
ncbi:MAG TPA: hypothetical protein VGL95_02860 [Acetobacteraceae bacterium]|jgi:uncharacterized protein (DUF1501 family)